MVLPPAFRASTPFFSVSTEVMSWVLAMAVSAKLTTAIRLPEPISSGAPPVASAMMSIKVLDPSFMLLRGTPAMLPERSSSSTMSVGFEMISGAAVSARVTRRDPSQLIRSVLINLFEPVTPICVTSFRGRRPRVIL